jgi:hypothetical protein
VVVEFRPGYPVTKEHAGTAPGPEPVEERRDVCRSSPRSEDWETIALQRVARKIEALTAGGAGGADGPTPADYGWEEPVLHNLKRRLKGRGPR